MTNLKIQNLSFFYDNRKCDGVDRINFELKGGELCAILGPSGSGKTTLLKIIAKMLKPQNGSIEYSTDLVTELYMPHDHVHQLGHAANQTLIEYLSGGNEIIHDKIRDQIAFMELSDEFFSPLKNLSTGQWHRAQLAKYFYNDNDLLLLDEPFIHLDPSRRQYIAECLLRLAKENKKIVLWSTHFLDDALMLADNILLLQHGVQQQFSNPMEMYWKPDNLFVASYSGENNLLMASTTNVPGEFKTQLGTVHLPDESLTSHNKDVILMCRPHLCSLVLDSQLSVKKSESNLWKMRLEKISFFGKYKRLEFQIEGKLWWVDVEISANEVVNAKLILKNEYWIEVPATSWVVLNTF